MEAKRVFTCTNNHKEDCMKVFSKWDACEKCSDLKQQVITFEENTDNPHLPDVFRKAIKIFNDAFWERWHEEPYNVGAVMLEQELIKNGDDDSWFFKFKVVKK